MSLIEGNVPLLELSIPTRFYVDGLHHIEVSGTNVHMVYFVWQIIDGRRRKVAADYVRICPAASLVIPLHKRMDAPVMDGLRTHGGGLHS
jgi:hypothetical protein